MKNLSNLKKFTGLGKANFESAVEKKCHYYDSFFSIIIKFSLLGYYTTKRRKLRDREANIGSVHWAREMKCTLVKVKM